MLLYSDHVKQENKIKKKIYISKNRTFQLIYSFPEYNNIHAERVSPGVRGYTALYDLTAPMLNRKFRLRDPMLSLLYIRG